MTAWTVAPDTPTPDLVAAVEAVLQKRANQWRKPHTGITAAQRFVVTFDDGSSAFVKAPTDAATREYSRMEHHVLSQLRGEFVPRVLHTSETLLITEDLSEAWWPADNPGADGPVTWKPGQVEALLVALDRLADAAPELPLPELASGKPPVWPRIAAEPEAFGVAATLALALESAEAQLDFAGDAIVHNDVRSDNVCFIGDRAVLVDWTNARRGHPAYDRVEIALTYAIEGGPPPWELVPDDAGFPVWHAGFLLTKAHDLAHVAPDWLVAVMKRCAAIAVAWSERNLSLG